MTPTPPLDLTPPVFRSLRAMAVLTSDRDCCIFVCGYGSEVMGVGALPYDAPLPDRTRDLKPFVDRTPFIVAHRDYPTHLWRVTGCDGGWFAWSGNDLVVRTLYANTRRLWPDWWEGTAYALDLSPDDLPTTFTLPIFHGEA